ncbi:MAG: helix-turn-helix domain-containing protein [Proteobacteria bacterium]|nr:helix-turn-helix domain-containing protein [Pseudomonadota bacterium]
MTHEVATAEPAGLNEQPAGRPIPRNPDALLFTTEAALLTGLSPRTLESLRLRGGSPPYYAVTPRAIRYKRSDLDAWIAERRRRNTSDPGAFPAGDQARA